MPEMIRTQASGRRDQNIFDQYGRKYLVAVDIKIDVPTGGVDLAGWSDPLRTPRHILRYKRDDMGRPMYDCRLVQLLDEKRQETTEWKRRHGHYTRHTPKGTTPAEILEMTGPPPYPPVKAIEMALGGSKGLLGLAPLTKAELDALELDAEYARAQGWPVEPEKSAKGPKAALAEV